MITPEFWEHWDDARFGEMNHLHNGNGGSAARMYGVSHSHGWSGPSSPPVDRYFKTLIDDLESELEQLCALEVYSREELRAECGRLVAVINKALGQ